jgi:anti-sigma B factor antagonist
VEELQIETVSGGVDGVRILRLAGPFTLRTLFDFQSLVREGNEQTTFIDLTEVPYIDSAALGCLMGVHVSSKRLNRRYALVGASARLMSLFNMCGVDDILVTYPTLDEAQKAMIATANSA